LDYWIDFNHFVGALIEAHLANGTFYNGLEYDTVWVVAVQLDVPT